MVHSLRHELSYVESRTFYCRSSHNKTGFNTVKVVYKGIWKKRKKLVVSKVKKTVKLTCLKPKPYINRNTVPF